jgi:Flp pilus assembly protein TadD
VATYINISLLFVLFCFVFLIQGVALLKLGNAADALKDIEKSLSQDPDNHYAAAQRGDALDHLLRVCQVAF